MSDAFSIVDADGTPIQYGSSNKPARRRSSPAADALSDPTYYLPVAALAASAVTPAAASRGGQNLSHPFVEDQTLAQRRLELPPSATMVRSGSARVPRTPRTLGASADEHGRSDASRCLNPSNVCVPLGGIHVNESSEWSLDWSNNASSVGRGPGGPGAPAPKRAQGAAGTRTPFFGGPASGGSVGLTLWPLVGLAVGVAMGWLLGWQAAPSDALLALLRLPGGLWASVMQVGGLLLLTVASPKPNTKPPPQSYP